MRGVALAMALGVALLVSGCGTIDDFVNRPTPVVAALEVFNRTEADLFYVAADGERLDVPACGSASDPSFRIDDVRVRTADGYIRGFGVNAPEFAGGDAVLVEVADAADSGLPALGAAPAPLPPCEGLPQVQAGI